MQFWIIAGLIAGIIVYLGIGVVVMLYVLGPTIDFFASTSNNVGKPSTTTAGKGGKYIGDAFLIAIVVVLWPLVLAICGIIWFFWGLGWVVGKIAEFFEGRSRRKV